MGDEETVLADHLRQKDARVLADAIGDQVIIERFLRIAGPTHDPSHVARGERVGVLGTEITGRIKGAVGDHHLHWHATAGDRRIKFVGELHAHSRAAGKDASAARCSTVRDAQLRVLAIGNDIFGVEFTVSDHLSQRHHRRGVRANWVGRNHIDIGILSSLRRRDAAVDSDCSLFYCRSCWHNSLRSKWSLPPGRPGFSVLPLAVRADRAR